jgi:hypothetical protein
MVAIIGTAWLAITSWAAANCLRAFHRASAARVVWTGGALALLGHVLLAFHIVHDWDHDAAFRAVAQETYQHTGLDWGGGIYVNHAFAGLWLVDAAFWWIAPARYLRRSRILDWAVQFVFLFMFVNATIVFGTARAAIAGLVLCALGALAWARYACRRGSMTT